jgi:hypothetical protein
MQIDLSWQGLTQPGSGGNYFGIDPLPPFDPEQAAFDPVNAFWLSEICRLIYRRNPDEDPDRIGSPTRNDILAQVACREVLFIRRQETQCALIQSAVDPAAFAVLVFRGTTGFRNWLLDLDVRPEKLGASATVHRGFSEALQHIWNLLQPALDGLEAPCFFTGHSMGGALAQLAATRFRPRAVYCFGAPRVGDQGYVDLMRPVPVYRIVNSRDVVALLPPANQILPFRPAGRLVYICAQGLLREIEDDEAADLACETEEDASPIAQESRWHDPPRFLADHAPINYSARIGQYLQGLPAENRADAACRPGQGMFSDRRA